MDSRESRSKQRAGGETAVLVGTHLNVAVFLDHAAKEVMRQVEDRAGTIAGVDFASAGAAVFHAAQHREAILPHQHGVKTGHRRCATAAPDQLSPDKVARGRVSTGARAPALRTDQREHRRWGGGAQQWGCPGGTEQGAAGAAQTAVDGTEPQKRTTTVSRVARLFRSAMKPMPQASRSYAGSYSPTAFGGPVIAPQSSIFAPIVVSLFACGSWALTEPPPIHFPQSFPQSLSPTHSSILLTSE